MSIWSLEGEEATWKTGTAYTAPPPIVGFQLDMGFTRAIYGLMYDRYFKELDIKELSYPFGGDIREVGKLWRRGDNAVTVFNMNGPIQLDSSQLAGSKELFTQFLFLVSEALQDPYVKSVVVDTMTLARRIGADGYLQGLQEDARRKGDAPRRQLLQIEYGKPNDFIRDIYTTAQVSGKNFIAIHHITDQYEEYVDRSGETKTRTTGKRILEGLGNTYRFVDIALRMEKKLIDDIYNPGTRRTAISATFQKCGYNLSLEGTSVIDPSWDAVARRVNLTIPNMGAQIPLKEDE